MAAGTGAAAATRPASLVVQTPSPALAAFVDRLGYYEAASPGGRELVLPTGTVALIVNLARDEARWCDTSGESHIGSGAVLLGASAGRISADVGDWQSGLFVSFRPGGAHPFFRPPMSAIGEPVVELAALWGRGSALLREQLLDAPTPRAVLSAVETVLLGRVVRPLERDPAVAAAAALLGRGTPVAEVADRIGWTDRTLLRRFTDQVGLTPKRFARVRRLQCLLAHVPLGGEVDWARAAVECGYFDQAHLINDFRALTGVTPGEYRPRSAACRNHELAPN